MLLQSHSIHIMVLMNQSHVKQLKEWLLPNLATRLRESHVTCFGLFCVIFCKNYFLKPFCLLILGYDGEQWLSFPKWIYLLLFLNFAKLSEIDEFIEFCNLVSFSF